LGLVNRQSIATLAAGAVTTASRNLRLPADIDAGKGNEQLLVKSTRSKSDTTGIGTTTINNTRQLKHQHR
jgi:hypothetical protein